VVKDEHRTDELRQARFNVFRFTDEEVLINIQGVASEIKKIIEEITSPCTPSRGGQPSSCRREQANWIMAKKDNCNKVS